MKKPFLTLIFAFVLFASCTKPTEQDFKTCTYSAVMSGASEFTVSYSGEGYDLALNDTITALDSNAQFVTDVPKLSGDFYFLKVSPIPSNAPGVSISLRIELDGALEDSSTQYNQKGLTLTGYLP